jgi:PEP-CTERM motif
MRRYALRFLLVAITFTVVNAKADPFGGFSLSFNELQFGEDVLEYYNGGFGSAGSGPGPALGLSFTAGLIAVEGDVYLDPDGKAAELDAPEVIMNISGGFSGLVQFYVLGGPIDVAFYDELDGLGNLVGTISSPEPDAVNETLLEFHSAVFSGTNGLTRIDVLSFGPPGGPLLTPEPSTLLLLATGIGLVCIRLRRKGAVERGQDVPH